MEEFLRKKTPQWGRGGVIKEQNYLMEDMINYFRKLRKWKNRNLGNKSSTSIKEAEKDEAEDIQSTNKSTNQSINQKLNRLKVKLFKQILAFQLVFTNLSNFNILFPSLDQVFDKLLAVLFYSFVIKSNIFSNNSNILIASFIQVFINFPA